MRILTDEEIRDLPNFNPKKWWAVMGPLKKKAAGSNWMLLKGLALDGSSWFSNKATEGALDTPYLIERGSPLAHANGLSLTHSGVGEGDSSHHLNAADEAVEDFEPPTPDYVLVEDKIKEFNKNMEDNGVLLGKPFPQEDILEEALRITSGDRNKDYGAPGDEFEKVARMWSVIIGAPVEMRHVPLCMVALKIVRECNKPKRDNRVDGAGYFRCLDLAERDSK